MLLPRWVCLGLVLAGCAGEEAPATLTLQGPSTVKVEQLGPVDGPTVQLSDGTPAHGVQLSVEPATVARIDGAQVVAMGHGDATVTAAWEDQQVQWSLQVSPSMRVAIIDPPITVSSGSETQLVAKGMKGGDEVALEKVHWESSSPDIATIDNGKLRAVGTGVVYITASAHGGKAMIEIQVLP